MGGLDSPKSYERTDSSLETKAECSAQRQSLGDTFANDMCTPEAPKSPEKNERQIVDENFSKMKLEFDALGIPFNSAFYKAGYYGLVAKDKRPPIELVYGRMNIFFMKAKESTLAKTILHNRSKDLLEILQFHLLGKDREASEHEIELFANIDAKILINRLETTIGTKFNDNQAKQFLSQLSRNGINPKDANGYIGKIKNLSPDNFKLLKGSKDLLIQNLLALILTLREVGPKAKDLVRAQLEIMAKFTQEFIANKKLIDENKAVVQRFGQRITNYKKEHPGVELDETLAKYEATMIDAAHNVAYYEMLQALTTTKSDLALVYLSKSGKNTKYSKAKGVIADIFQSKNSTDIKNLSTKYNIELPATLSSLQTAESNFETKSVDEYIARETGNNSYARDAYDKFYKTGKVEGADKKAILARLAFESDKLIDSSNKLVSRINSESIFFDQLTEKYKNIAEVPVKERRAAILKSQGYLQLLNQHANIQARLLSIAATYDILEYRPEKGHGDSEKRSWEEMVGEMRQEAADSMEKGKVVAKFLQMNKYETTDLNQASLSRLTLTLIQKENAGLEAKYKGVMDNVSNNYESLGNIMGQFEKAQNNPDWAEEHGTKLVRIFNQGTEAYAKIIPSVEATRNKFTEMRGDLFWTLSKVEKGDSPLLKLHPQLKDVYLKVLQNAIKSIDQVLENPSSPISTQQLSKLKLAQRDFEKSRQDFLNGTLKNIAAFIIIMATSIAGGIAGSYLISAALKTSSIFIVPIGTSLGGVIGSRVGMTVTDASGLTKYGSENIWDPKTMGRDFIYGYGLSLGAIMTAKGAISTLSIASHSKNATVAARASGILKTIQKAKSILSPLEFEHAKTSLRRFGAKFGEEYAEETIEEAAGEIGKRTNNPYLEFFVSVINASDGKSVKLNMAGVNTKKVGVSTEGNNITYTTKTPEEFIANLKAEFADRKGSSFDSKINSDGSITLSIYGQTLHQSIAEITIHPAEKSDVPKVEKSLDLAEKIEDSPVKKTAKEIIRELFETTEKSKDAFLRTVAKFKSIGVYLAENAKELFVILNEEIQREASTLGFGGTQILNMLGNTFNRLRGRNNKKPAETSDKKNILTPKDAQTLLTAVRKIHDEKIKVIGTQFVRTEQSNNGIILTYDRNTPLKKLLKSMGINTAKDFSEMELKLTVDNVEIYIKRGRIFNGNDSGTGLRTGNPYHTLFFADLPANQSDRSEFVQKALNSLLKSRDSETIFDYLDIFKHEEYAATILLSATKLSPVLAFYHFDRYKDQPYAERIIRYAAQQDPVNARVYASKFQDEPYGQDILNPPEVAYKPVFDTPEKIERIRSRVEEIINDIIYHDVKVLFFLDRSARPVYWMLKAAWDAKKLGRPMPKVKFLNIGSEKKEVLGYDDQPKRSDFTSDKEYERAVKQHWEQLHSTDYIAKVKKDISPLLTEEGVDTFGKPYKGKVMVIDDISISQVTQRMAIEFLGHHFPGVKVYNSTLLNRYDEDLFPPLPGGTWTNLPWNADNDKDYTLMSPQDDPRKVVAKPELNKNKRKKGLGLKKEIDGIFKGNPLNFEKGTALNLAEKITDPEVKQTAKEIVVQIFEKVPLGEAREVFIKTARKFKSIGSYLKSNAKELFDIFDAKLREQGMDLGISGTQILQLLYETVAEFAGKKVDIQKVNRKFKVGDVGVYPDGNRGMRDVFVKNIDPQTGEVTLRTTDLSGYERKVSAANFLLFNKSRRGGVTPETILVSDYKIGDIVGVMRNGKIENGIWKIVGIDEGTKQIILESWDGVIKQKIHVAAKDIQPKKSDIEENPKSQEYKELTDADRKLIQKLFPEGIETSHFEQQNIGNCYVLSFLHSFKRHPLAPLFVARMVRPANGGWNVKFPGEEEVFLPTEELDGKKEWDKEEGRWVFNRTVKGQLGDKILVLAHAKWRRTKNSAHVPGQTVLESGWGHSTEPMNLFLKEYSSNIDTVGGDDYTKSLSEVYRDQVKVSALLDSFSKNPKDYILTASPPVKITPYTRHTGGEFDKICYYMDPEYRFVQKHSYSIVATNAEARTITIANPHDTKGKEHTISYDEFFQYFRGVDIVKFDPAKIKGVDFMKAQYVDGVINAPLQRAIETKFDAKENLLIKMGPRAIISCELQGDGSIFLNMEQATGVRGGSIIRPGSELIVGANTIPNMPGTVSGSHIKVKNLGNGSFTITDLNSTNGTTVYKTIETSRDRDVSINDGKINEWLTANKPVRFDSRVGLSIGLGRQAKIQCILQSDGSIFLNMEQATGVRGGPIIKPGSELIVGANTIPNMPGTVSGSHVKVKNLGNGYFSITDLASRNGTFVTNN